MPRAENAHIEAAVVNPKTFFSSLLIKAPAPRKPIPVIIPPITNKGLESPLNCMAPSVITQDPVATSIKVPKPIGFFLNCLSRPKIPDSTKASNILNITVNVETGSTNAPPIIKEYKLLLKLS